MKLIQQITVEHHHAEIGSSVKQNLNPRICHNVKIFDTNNSWLFLLVCTLCNSLQVFFTRLQLVGPGM
jgi:hypothetical protein